MTMREKLCAGCILLFLVSLGFGRTEAVALAQPAAMTGTMVHFPVTCSNEAQAMFDQAMALEHMFSHEEAADNFSATLRLDPTCSIAYWGMALATLNNLFLIPGPASIDKSRDLLRAAETQPPKSAREADYIGALQALLGNCGWEACTKAFMRA